MRGCPPLESKWYKNALWVCTWLGDEMLGEMKHDARGIRNTRHRDEPEWYGLCPLSPSLVWVLLQYIHLPKANVEQAKAGWDWVSDICQVQDWWSGSLGHKRSMVTRNVTGVVSSERGVAPAWTEHGGQESESLGCPLWQTGRRTCKDVFQESRLNSVHKAVLGFWESSSFMQKVQHFSF